MLSLLSAHEATGQRSPGRVLILLGGLVPPALAETTHACQMDPHIFLLQEGATARWAIVSRGIAIPVRNGGVVPKIGWPPVDLVAEMALQWLSRQPGLRRFIS